MCVSAAGAIKRQCGQDYGFAESENRRATDISIQMPQERDGLPTNNCISKGEICLDLTERECCFSVQEQKI